MDWTKLLLALVVILLYIPLIFMTANVLFPDFTGSHSYYDYRDPCTITKGDTIESNDTCFEEQRAEQEAFDIEKNQYNGNKYAFIAILNLIVLLVALLVSFEESILIGLFLGSVITIFSATWAYFETKSVTGLIALAITFFVALV